MKLKILVFYLFFFFPFFLFSQIENEFSDFEKIIKQKTDPYTNEIKFKKEQYFFLMKTENVKNKIEGLLHFFPFFLFFLFFFFFDLNFDFQF